MVYIYVGPTGCGKTYQAFNRLNKRQKAMYVAPCRQLVYESAMKYGNSNCHVATSDMRLGNFQTSPISFRTFEACHESDLRNIDVLIIDEAHFMADKERGQHLKNLVSFMEKSKKKTVLLSATLSFKVKGAKVIKLAPRGTAFVKEEVSLDEAYERLQQGIPTLIFHRRKVDCGTISRRFGMEEKCGIITADTSVEDRIKLVELYNRGKLTIIEATNAMAQGVNVPCENLINFYNPYDDNEVIVQKFGRLGRTGVTKENARLTYCFDKGGYIRQKTISEYNEKIKEKRRENYLSITSGRTEAIDYDLRTPQTKAQIESTKRRITKAWHNI